MQHTVDIIYLLSSFYQKVYIMKPHSSRYANSEKYLICKNFMHSSCEGFFPYLLNAFTKMITVESENIHRFINVPISNYFITKLEEFNAIFGQQQIENIYYTISLIDSKNSQEKIDNLIKSHINKCVQWCNKYDVPYNTISTVNENVFISI